MSNNVTAFHTYSDWLKKSSMKNKSLKHCTAMSEVSATISRDKTSLFLRQKKHAIML